jgi:hypothetical protein
MSHKEEPELKVSPAADEAMRKLVELFSDPSLASKARFRCGTEGPGELDVWFSGSDVFMGSDLFPEFRASGKRKKRAPIKNPGIDSCVFHPRAFP